MIYLLDKTDCLYQWDSDRQVAIDNPNITEMHFCRKRDSKAVVVDVVVEDGIATAFIPNFLLQTADDISVFAYEHNHTVETTQIHVIKRQKPEDYVYTEIEIKRWENLEQYLDRRMSEGALSLYKHNITITSGGTIDTYHCGDIYLTILDTNPSPYSASASYDSEGVSYQRLSKDDFKFLNCRTTATGYVYISWEEAEFPVVAIEPFSSSFTVHLMPQWDVYDTSWSYKDVEQIRDDVEELGSINSVLNGISPTIQIVPIANGNRVLITDIKGTHSFDIKNGGTPKAPERGKDYWTQADIQYIKDYINEKLADIGGGGGGGFATWNPRIAVLASVSDVVWGAGGLVYAEKTIYPDEKGLYTKFTYIPTMQRIDENMQYGGEFMDVKSVCFSFPDATKEDLLAKRKIIGTVRYVAQGEFSEGDENGFEEVEAIYVDPIEFESIDLRGATEGDWWGLYVGEPFEGYWDYMLQFDPGYGEYASGWYYAESIGKLEEYEDWSNSRPRAIYTFI